MRLQAFAQDWRELRGSIKRHGLDERAARVRLDALDEEASEEEREAARAGHIAELKVIAPLLAQRQAARLPIEIPIQLIFLCALTYVGVWRPMSMMGAFEANEKLNILGPILGIVVLLWLVMMLVAVSSWRRMRREGKAVGATRWRRLQGAVRRIAAAARGAR
jgi:hypothetical protein